MTADQQRILVVDDESSILELLRDALTEAGYAVDAAENAQAALALVQDNLYDVAILDFALPDMNGVMLHHELRRVDAELAERTLFISGLTQSDDDLDYFSSLASGFLPKPFEVADVLADKPVAAANPVEHPRSRAAG